MMKWNLKSFSVVKALAVTASVVTMCTTPLAQGAQAKDRAKQTQKELINHYLRTTGLTTKKMTAGEYWRMVRPVYPAKFQKYMDAWISAYNNTPMPTIDATALKGPDGEQVRLLFSNGSGQTMAATFTGDMDRPVKINGLSLSKKELMNVNQFEGLLKRLAKEDPSLKKMIKDTRPPKFSYGRDTVLSIKEFRKLTAAQKAEYFIRLRRAAEAAQKVFITRYGAQAWNELQHKHQWAVQFLLGTPAEARVSDLAGKPCIVAGWISVYGENGSCGGTSSGQADLQAQMSRVSASCSGNSVPCNPMVYGFDGSGGSHCIPRQPRETINNATALCGQKAPISTPEEKKAIVESYMKKVKGQEINLELVDGKVSEEQYAQVAGFFDDLGMFIAKASEECEKDPLKQIRASGQRDDQNSACDEIKTRAFALDAFKTARPEPPIPAGPSCEDELSGSVLMGEKCECPEGAIAEDQGGGKQACVFADKPAGPAKDEKKKKGGSLLPILGILAVVGIGAYLIFKDKDKKNPPTHVTPNPPLEPTPTPTVTPPPTNCEPPNTIVNGVCTPPVVVPVDETEGGTKDPVTGIGGGVR